MRAASSCAKMCKAYSYRIARYFEETELIHGDAIDFKLSLDTSLA